MPWRESENHTLDPTRVAVLGAGHAGRGLASYLSLHGLDVSLYNRTKDHVKGILEANGIHMQGIVEAFAPLQLITDDMAYAIDGRKLLIVTVPAQAHTFFAETMGPHLEEGQTVLLMPGRTGGALEFAKVLSDNSYGDGILLGEAQTFSLVSRTTGPDSVLVSKVKNYVEVSAFPASHNRQLVNAFNRLPLTFQMVDDVMDTSLNNIGAMLHPTPTILCAGLLESKKGGYNHYHDAISKTVGKLVERMDAERIKVSQQFVSQPMPLLEWLRNTYDAEGSTLCECIRSIDTYDEVGSPSSLDHRYVLEDVPTGLVPISHFGKLAGVETPAIDAVIDMACQLYEVDFWGSGRNLETLGLEGLSPTEVREYVRTGTIPDSYPSFPDHWDLYGLEVDET
ncbi:MAG: NAD/NADP octopine/nopaline dehydrogenase family protein [Candidatus Thorarchaeota archaeon]